MNDNVDKTTTPSTSSQRSTPVQHESIFSTSSRSPSPSSESESALLIPRRNKKRSIHATSNGLSAYMRWIVLFAACALLFGNYYCYDIPGATNTQLNEYLDLPYEEWQVKMNSLYTAYSTPNLIMPIIGGILMDSIGTSRMLIAFAVVTMAGQILFTIGIVTRVFWVMALGRAVFGLGGETLEVAQARITSEWFANSYLGLALSLNLTSARISSASNDFISPHMSSPVIASWIGVGVCILSLIAAVFLSVASKRSFMTRYIRVYGNDVDDASSVNVDDYCQDDGDVKTLNNLDESSVSIDIDQEENDETKGLLDSPATVATKVLDETIRNEPNDEFSEKISWTSITRFPRSFWLLCIGAMTLYGAVNPFIHILTDLLQKKWYPNDASRAGMLMSIPDLISAVLSPLGGFIIDYMCQKDENMQKIRAYLIPLAGLTLIITHYLMAFTMTDPLISLVLIGFAYSIFGAALWPLIPHFIKDKRILGSAYGVSAVALNIMLAISPMIVASLLTTGGYQLVGQYFIGLSCFCTIVGILIVWNYE